MAKRLFVAVNIKPTSQLIFVYQKLQLKLKGDKIKWVDPDNFHLTLKFIGETDEDLLLEIISEIENLLENFNRFKITLLGFGRFSTRKHTRVIWLGIDDPNNQLSIIANKLNRSLKPLGIKPEQKTFKAHLTVGRVKFIQNERVLSDFMNTYSNQKFQEISIDEIILYESVLTSSGPVYNSLKVVKFEE